ncbi:MAG: hypothetical protein IJU33_01040 [Bacteroidales bacterium]|nr:hypothetical protein [Bacteroidales bacterium]
MDSFLSLYNQVEYKIKQATVRYQECKKENEELKAENERLQEELGRLKLQLQENEEKYKLVTITKTILNKEDKKDIKKEINDLVREIDNCIEYLGK